MKIFLLNAPVARDPNRKSNSQKNPAQYQKAGASGVVFLCNLKGKHMQPQKMYHWPFYSAHLT